VVLSCFVCSERNSLTILCCIHQWEGNGNLMVHSRSQGYFSACHHSSVTQGVVTPISRRRSRIAASTHLDPVYQGRGGVTPHQVKGQNVCIQRSIQCSQPWIIEYLVTHVLVRDVCVPSVYRLPWKWPSIAVTRQPLWTS